jgi:hypothetical protein
MSITETVQKIKGRAGSFINSLAGKDAMAVSIVILVGLSGFGLGRLSSIYESREPVTITLPEGERTLRAGETVLSKDSTSPSYEKTTGVSQSSAQVVASQNGSKYYFPWCASAAKIKESNKVFFASAAAAEAAGYTPAANCKGLGKDTTQ